MLNAIAGLVVFLLLVACKTVSVPESTLAPSPVYKTGWPLEIGNIVANYSQRELERLQWQADEMTMRPLDDGDRLAYWYGENSFLQLRLDAGLERHIPDRPWRNGDEKVLTQIAIDHAERRIQTELPYVETVSFGVNSSNSLSYIYTVKQGYDRDEVADVLATVVQQEMENAHFGPFHVMLDFDHLPPELVDGQQRGVYFDLGRLSVHYRDYTAAIVAVMREKYGDDPQVLAQMVLGFLQSIPYEELSLDTSRGLHTPEDLIARNLGDCDSKSLFWLSAMHDVLPDHNKLVVLTENHAFVGLEVKPGDNRRGIILTIEGMDYQLMEPVGPVRAAPGLLTDASITSLQNGHWMYQVVPAATNSAGI